MTDTQTLPKEKKKRIRKPKPTPVQQVIDLCAAMTLDAQVLIFERIKEMLDKRKVEMEAALKTLEGL